MTDLALKRSRRKPRFSAILQLPSSFSILHLAILATLVSLAGTAFLPLYLGSILDNIQQIIATMVGGFLILRATRSESPAQRFVARGVLLSLVFVVIGLLAWDLTPDVSIDATGPDDVLFVIAIAILLVILPRALFHGVERETMLPLVLDALIMIVASITVLFALWELSFGLASQDWQPTTELIGAIVIFSGPVAGYLILLHRQIEFNFRGAYATLAGSVLIGSAWLIWLTLLSGKSAAAISPPDFIYSLGILLLAYGVSTWNLAPSTKPKLNQLASIIVGILPLLAVGLCLVLSLIIPARSGLDTVRIGSAIVIGLTLSRQALLTQRERRARFAEREAADKLVNEIAERSDVLGNLSRLDVSGSLSVAAQQICEEALRLNGIDSVAVRIFRRDGLVEILAAAGISKQLHMTGTVLSADRSLAVKEQTAQGPWRQIYKAGDNDPHLTQLYEAGLYATLNVPLLWDNQLIGVLGLSSTISQETMPAERLTTAREFALVTASALGPGLAVQAHCEEVREGILETIAQHSFHPVFQPVIDLGNRSTIGFEALTRFDNGQRPDLYFLAADEAGLGLELETACLQMALTQATALPPTTWLSLNVSPALAIASSPLLALLEGVERKIVLEITEHLPIASYAELMNALADLRTRVRLAVDDAGSGYAGLQHLLEIKPDIMKLDIALVRNVDHDPGRHALIASMITFARETGCVVLAEGIETAAELETLCDLGVDLGQGYLLGRPATIGNLTALDVLELTTQRAA
jgi:EAL domain-containing protein (putative c-di-GMP-specific phosphodiesterase class I)